MRERQASDGVARPARKSQAVRLSKLNTVELSRVVDRGAVALWPIGATEAHGPHLPLGTDSVIAEATCERALVGIQAATGCGVVIVPVLSFGIADYARSFRGTVSIPAEVQESYVVEVLISLSQQGFRAIAMVNGHVEPAHRYVLRGAVRRAKERARCPIGIVDPADRRFAAGLGEEFASGSCHAGRYESSIVLAADAEGVDEAVRRELPRLEVDLLGGAKLGQLTFEALGVARAYCGDPAAASPEEGEELLGRLAANVVTVVRELLESG
ncbi:MAG: creatininase family protein [Deltaproteobacteria bacterium]|nr:creatininase family protein [Deltaproteobacteria bacterium]